MSELLELEQEGIGRALEQMTPGQLMGLLSEANHGFQAHLKVMSKLKEAIAPFSVTFGGSQDGGGGATAEAARTWNEAAKEIELIQPPMERFDEILVKIRGFRDRGDIPDYIFKLFDEMLHGGETVLSMGELLLEHERGFVLENGHLSSMRSAQQMGSQGLDSRRDFLGALEAIEKLFLIVLHLADKIEASPQGASVLITNSNATVINAVPTLPPPPRAPCKGAATLQDALYHGESSGGEDESEPLLRRTSEPRVEVAQEVSASGVLTPDDSPRSARGARAALLYPPLSPPGAGAELREPAAFTSTVRHRVQYWLLALSIILALLALAAALIIFKGLEMYGFGTQGIIKGSRAAIWASLLAKGCTSDTAACHTWLDAWFGPLESYGAKGPHTAAGCSLVAISLGFWTLAFLLLFFARRARREERVDRNYPADSQGLQFPPGVPRIAGVWA
ncbi:hypothetical protein T484DRAFT_1959881 [Baffinella frigidus]|nr:hypothetical protein T484DRAFT_1959881 [Cryptophyta sp. CCMP2293]